MKSFNVVPNKRIFNALAKEYTFVPVYKEVFLDTETPLTIFSKVKNLRYPFLLESVEGGEKWARYTFIGFDPFMIYQFNEGNYKLIHLYKREKKNRKTHNPLSPLKEIMRNFSVSRAEGLPRFVGGAVGYVSYDCIRYFEKVNITSKKIMPFPEAVFLFTNKMIIYDNLKHTFIIMTLTQKGEYEEGIKRIRYMEKLIKKESSPLKPLSLSEKKVRIRSNFSKRRFMEIVKKGKDYIFAGDVIQVVLSQRFETFYSGNPFNIYRALRMINPSPYMFYMDFNGFHIIGSSPEALVRVEGNNVEVRPIAGTRKRGKNSAEDAELEQELVNSEKEKAEHIMLVDLGRNDVGRIAETGSVKVTELMKVEKYSHVMHMVSTVTGSLREGKDAFDAFVSVFPAGTVSGAPKIRAMEIIDELEREKRGIYAGALGYIDFSGNMDTAITIRTLVKKGKKVYVQAGAGIVADSNPEAEYFETVSKAKALFKAVELTS